MPPPAPRAAAPHELWLLDLDACAARLAEIEAVTPRLSDDERRRAGAMSDQRQAKRWTAGRSALRILLEAQYGTGIRGEALAREAGGRPYLASGNTDFSVADSGSTLLVGIVRHGRIGVDVERRRELRMSPARIDLIMAAGEGLAGPVASPLQAWTRIEAVAKAVGPTLAACLARLGIQGHGEGALAPATVLDRARQQRTNAALEIFDLDLPDGLAGAVALARHHVDGTSPLPVRRLDLATIARLTA